MPWRLARYCPLTEARPFTSPPVARRALKEHAPQESGLSRLLLTRLGDARSGYLAGTSRLSSSNHFWTTMIRGAAAELAGGLTMRKRLPSPDTS
jgi:hypothetical protein